MPSFNDFRSNEAFKCLIRSVIIKTGKIHTYLLWIIFLLYFYTILIMMFPTRHKGVNQ